MGVLVLQGRFFNGNRPLISVNDNDHILFGLSGQLNHVKAGEFQERPEISAHIGVNGDIRHGGKGAHQTFSGSAVLRNASYRAGGHGNRILRRIPARLRVDCIPQIPQAVALAARKFLLYLLRDVKNADRAVRHVNL